MTEAQQEAPAKAACADLPITPFNRLDVLRVLATLGLVVSSFTFAGSLVLAIYTRLNPELDSIQAPGGLLLRVLLFGLVTLGSGVVLWQTRSPSPIAVPTWMGHHRITAPAAAAVLLILVVTALLLGFRIDHYPWAAPDEIHHLNVARNIAVHGSYASGHPGRALIYFDSFDSVGPTVLGPIAAAFTVTGVSLAAARWVMVAFFLLLGLASFQFCRRHFGLWSGVCSVGLLLVTFSSTYLGRTVYGEAPAYTCLLIGLLLWSRALGTPGVTGWGFVAGAVIGLAVLAKTIVLLVAFSLLGAWAYDRVSFQRIGWAHVVPPVIGGLAVLGAWQVFQGIHGAGSVDSGGVMDIYQHYLLFGVSGLPFNVANSIALNPVAHGVCFTVILISAPTVFRHRYSPPAVVLYCYALFMLYWWFFFTTGHLHRYLWNAYAITALFMAPWMVQAIRGIFDPIRRPALRVGCCLLAVIMLAPGARWITLQAIEISTKNEMVEEYLVVDAINALPPDYRVGTSSGRLPALVSFLSGRLVEGRVGTAVYEEDFDVIVIPDSPEDRATIPEGMSLKPVASFVLLSSTKTLE